MTNILKTKIIGVNFEQPTFKMVGGLGIDDIKIKYNWFLNAEVQDAIIGEDDNGLVWYSGYWINGTWENGTWYSGTWYDGRWKLGNFYSYDIDQTEMLLGKLKINSSDITKSQFLGGIWEGGTFHYGTFGRTRALQSIPSQITVDFVANYSVDYTLSGDTYIDEFDIYLDTGLTMSFPFSSPTFDNGDFLDGWINASIFNNGNFYNGIISNSKWYNGTFYNGTFLGDIWYNGYFYGGDFSNGTWKNGVLSTYKGGLTSRFGCNCNTSEPLFYQDHNTGITYYKPSGATWENGSFLSGEFHSSLTLKDGVPVESLDHTISNWLNGTFVNGVWYGGTFHSGIWSSGTFVNGVINSITWQNGNIINCIWNDGTFINGNISGGIFKSMDVIRGNIGCEF